MYFQFFYPDELNSPHWITILGGPILLTTPKTPEEEKIHLFLHHFIYARLIFVTERREHAPFYVLLNYFLSFHTGIMWQDFRAADKKGDQKLPCLRLQPAPGWPAAAGQKWDMNDSASTFWRFKKGYNYWTTATGREEWEMEEKQPCNCWSGDWGPADCGKFEMDNILWEEYHTGAGKENEDKGVADEKILWSLCKPHSYSSLVWEGKEYELGEGLLSF